MECCFCDVIYVVFVVVDIVYFKNGVRNICKNVQFCCIFVMFKSFKCYFNGVNNVRMEEFNECFLDLGGYFIVGGIEKVILIQEQFSKNCVIVEKDDKGGVQVLVISFIYECKFKIYVVFKKDCIFFIYNIFVEVIFIVIVFKVFGGLFDYDIMELVVGGDLRY